METTGPTHIECYPIKAAILMDFGLIGSSKSSCLEERGRVSLDLLTSHYRHFYQTFQKGYYRRRTSSQHPVRAGQMGYLRVSRLYFSGGCSIRNGTSSRYGEQVNPRE